MRDAGWYQGQDGAEAGRDRAGPGGMFVVSDPVLRRWRWGLGGVLRRQRAGWVGGLAVVVTVAAAAVWLNAAGAEAGIDPAMGPGVATRPLSGARGEGLELTAPFIYDQDAEGGAKKEGFQAAQPGPMPRVQRPSTAPNSTRGR